VLNEAEQNIVRQCLVAILDGPSIDDWEFQTRLGVDRQTLRTVLSERPNGAGECAGPAQVALNNCMNEIVNGLGMSADEWDKWFTVSRSEVIAVYRKWCALNVQSPGIK
jgi:hypothetical protein